MGKNGRIFFLAIVILALLPVVAWSANINEVSERVETVEDTLELLEESTEEIRAEIENKMQISGYVDVEYSRSKDEGSKAQHGFRMHHLSLFFKKKINSKWRFFSEIEYEDGPKIDNEKGNTVDVKSTDGDTVTLANFADAYGKIFVEAVNLDFLYRPEAIFRFGRFFTPAGIWSVDHYPPFVATQERPRHIRRIFPQLVDGAMVYGTLPIGEHFVNYDAYVGNGEGNNGNHDNDTGKAFGLKTSALLAISKFSHFEIGGTGYYDSNYDNSDQVKTAFGIHAKMKMMAYSFQSEAAFAKFDGSGQTRKGYYAQFSYEPNQWSGGYRYDYYNEGSETMDRVVHALFVNYRVSTNIVAKVEHHFKTQKSVSDNDKTIISIVSYLE